MTKESMTTLENIHKAAKEEFLEKGFKGASLRNIVKTAGMTTGSFLRLLRQQRGTVQRPCRQPVRYYHGRIYKGSDRFQTAGSVGAERAYGRYFRPVHGMDGGICL